MQYLNLLMLLDRRRIGMMDEDRSCHFCKAPYDKSMFWRIGNRIDDEMIWLCYDCMSKDNIDKWLRTKGLFTEILPHYS